MSREEFIGNSRRNLVLKTAGIIRVLVGDKYYDINFRDSHHEGEQDKDGVIESDFIIAQNINAYKNGLIDCPADGKIVFTLTGDIYYVNNGEFHKYGLSDSNAVSKTTENIFNETVNFKAPIPFKLSNNNLIYNMNAQYLNGKTDDDFILNDANIKLRNLIVDSISTSDGSFSYKNGNLVIPESYFVLKNISESVKIGGFNIIDYEEIEYSKMIPYENTLIDDLINYISINDNYDYSIIKNMVNIINSSNINLSLIDEYNKDEQLDKLKQIKDYLFATPNDSLFDDIKNNIVDINMIPYNKASYVLTVDSSSGINIYDKFKAYITKERYIDNNGNYTYNSCDGDYYDDYIIEVNCIVTKVSDKRVSITTDYESNIYKYQEKNSYNLDFCGSEITCEEYTIPSIDSNNYNSFICESKEYISDIDLSSGSIIGLLDGQIVYGEKISGYGLLVRDNGYFLNSKIYDSDVKLSNIFESNIIDCYIRNNIEYVELYSNDDYYINPDISKTYSLKSNGGRIVLNNSAINGVIINIYSIDDFILTISGIDLEISANTYNSFMNVPVGTDEYKWVNIK